MVPGANDIAGNEEADELADRCSPKRILIPTVPSAISFTLIVQTKHERKLGGLGY